MADRRIFDFHAFLDVLIGNGNFGKSKYQALINMIDMLSASEVLLDDGEYEYEQSFLLKIYNGREKMPKQVVHRLQSSIDETHIVESLKDHLSEDVYDDVLTKLFALIENDPYLNEENTDDLEKLSAAREALSLEQPGQLIFHIYRYVILSEPDIRTYSRKLRKTVKKEEKNDEFINLIDSMSRSQLDLSGVKALCGKSHGKDKELFAMGSVPPADKVIRVLNDSERWQIVSHMFSTITNLPNHKLSDRYDNGKNLFELITGLVGEGATTFPLNISGEFKSGKTLFLQTLYYYILDRYRRNDIDYFPIYLDVGVFFNENKRNNQIKAILKKTYKLAAKRNSRILVLLDGISSITNNDFDNQNRVKANIEKLVGRSGKGRDQRIRVVCAINTNADLAYSIGNLRKKWPLHAEEVMYINSVDLMNVYEDQKGTTREFAEAFIRFREISSPEVFYENLRKVDINRISLNFLMRFEEDLTSPQGSIDIAGLYDDYLNENEDLTRIYDIAPEIAYEIYFSGKNYADLSRGYGDRLSYKAYDLIRQREMIFYLIAKHYLNTIIDLSDLQDDSIAQKSNNMQNQSDLPIPEDAANVIDRIYNKNFTTLMLNIITNHGNEYSGKIYSFIKEFYKSVEPTGMVGLSYLLGRIDKDRESCLELLNNILDHLSNIISGSVSSSPMTNIELAVRSIKLSIIHKTSHQDKGDRINSYIKELLGSWRNRFVNRSFQRLYYGDERVRDGFDMDTDVRENERSSMDYYNTFHSLVHRLTEKMDESNQVYPLMQLDLFTLCDLLNASSNDVYAGGSGEKGEHTYFYSDSRHRMETLEITDSLIDRAYDKINDKSFHIYLDQTMKRIAYLKSLDMTKPETFVQYVKTSDVRNRMGALQSTGLGAGVTVSANDSNINVLDMAMLYLPQNIKDFREYSVWSSSMRELYSSYNKDIIIKMIMLDDLSRKGRLSIENMNELLIAGAVNGTADLLSYYNLWIEYNEGKGINASVAYDMIHVNDDEYESETDLGKYIKAKNA